VVSTATITANNTFLIPNTGSSTVNALVYSGTPLTQTATFSAPDLTFAIFAKPTANANDTKYYVVSRASQASVTILNANFQPIGQPLNLGQSVTAAALSPDGKRLAVMAGNFRLWNTDTDEEIRGPNFLDVGLRPNDIVWSQDSRFACFISAEGQKITFVNIPAFGIQGSISISDWFPTTAFGATGPNGMIYVSADSRVLEIDPNFRALSTNTPIDQAAIRRRFVLNNARVGRLQFTPDGTRALAVNNNPSVNGTLLYAFNLPLNGAGGFTEYKGADLPGIQIAKVFVGGNSSAYAISNNNTVARERLYAVTIPPAPAAGEAFAVPTLQEAFFSSVGNIQIADQVVFSPEYPNPFRALIYAPLQRLSPNAPNTLYDMNLVGGASRGGEIRLTSEASLLAYAGPAATTPPQVVGGIVPINSAHPNYAPGARTLPIGVKVLSVTGRPIFGNPVTFAPSLGSPAIEGSPTVATNANGLAFITVIAPSAPGDFVINATPVNGPAIALRMTVAAPDPGGGGGSGGGGNTGGPYVELIGGDGQVIREGERTCLTAALDANGRPIDCDEYSVRFFTAPGRPAGGLRVQWDTDGQSFGWSDGEITDVLGRRFTVTDRDGYARNSLWGAVAIGFGNSFVPGKASVLATINSIEVKQEFAYTTYQRITPDGNLAPPPSTIILSPEPLNIRGKTGQTIPGLLQVQVTAATGLSYGAVMPGVGVAISTENQDPTRGPVLSCAQRPVVLTNERGLAVCDVKLAGKAGTASALVKIGGYSRRPLFVTLDPGEPNNLKILSGDNQSAAPNENLLPLSVQLDDGGGSFLQGVRVRWTVVQGSAIIANPETFTDSQGRSTNNVRLGLVPGVVTIRVVADGGSNPTVTFNLRINAVVAALARVSGDGQSTFIGTAFAAPLIVQVNDNRGLPVPGQVVTFTIASGLATIVGATSGSINVTTDTAGRASVQVRAGAQSGSVVINASTPGVIQTATFTLAVQLPGPQVTRTDFYNSASNEKEAVSPGGLFTIVGRGFAQDLRGCVQGQPNQVGPWPTRVANVEVQFGTFLAPILAVCNESNRESINVQVPFEVLPGTVDVIIRTAGAQSTVTGVRVVDLQPGIFETTDSQGRRYATALRPNGTFVTPENPARWGEIIRIFITGGGQSNPRAQTGVPGAPGQQMVITPVVGINDQGARGVSFNYVVGSIGIFEVQIEIPDGTQTGNNRPVGVLLPRPGTNEFVFTFNAPVIAITTR
jgi:uncharacterized protein (TIGR03437 family)